MKPVLLAQNQNLNHLIDPGFQGVNRLFTLAFENDAQRTTNKRYYLTNVELKDYNVHDSWKKKINQRVKNNKITYENIRKVVTGQRDDYTAGCFLDYIYFKNYYKIVSVDLSKQQKLDADPKNLTTILFYCKFR